MNQLKGYAGKIAKINLSSKDFTTVDTANYAEKYIGGRGIATRMYFEDVAPEVGAFDPENTLYFMTGPLGGTLGTGSGRTCLIGKSPQSYPVESICDSNCGGDFGPAMKFAGFDGIAVTGKADNPVYVLVEDGNVEFKDASALWGLGTFETQRKLWEIHGTEAQVLVIGPAGEKLARVAHIQHQSGCAFGQGGFGGVMGSKNLKAIVAKGTGSLEVADPQGLIDMRLHAKELISPVKFGESAKGVKNKLLINSAGYFQHWWQEGGFWTGWHTYEKEGIGKMGINSCFGCPFGCRTSMTWADDVKANTGVVDGSTTCFEAWGYYQQWYKWADIDVPQFMWNMAQNDLGINSVELTALYWLLEKGAEEGIFTSENTGWPLDKMGKEYFDINSKTCKNMEFIQAHLADVANRQGLGDKVADGLARFINYVESDAKFGPNRNRLRYWYNTLYPKAGKFADGYRTHFNAINYGLMFYSVMLYQVVAQRDPETKHVDNGFLNPYAYQHNIKGATNIYPGNEEWQKMVPVLMKKYIGTDKPANAPGLEDAEVCARWFWRMNLETDILTLCDWLMQDLRAIRFWSVWTADGFGDMEIGKKFYNTITGNNLSQEEIWERCEAVFTLERAIACREGRTAADDIYNNDWYEYGKSMGCTPEGAPGSGVVGKFCGTPFEPDKLRQATDKFYALLGWSENGVPTEQRLNELGMEDVAHDLKARGLLALGAHHSD